MRYSIGRANLVSVMAKLKKFGNQSRMKNVRDTILGMVLTVVSAAVWWELIVSSGGIRYPAEFFLAVMLGWIPAIMIGFLCCAVVFLLWNWLFKTEWQ